ncbi:MAG TPA: dienelactone hydrolase family protein [Thermodesulfobacteriota bacterium]|nr:dienelactone hydrolase family protein [Thermodesulfobacteriota bacterium]
MNQHPQKPGIYKQAFSQEDRRYTIYLPDDLPEDNEPSLIMLLHWKGPMYPFKGLEILSGLGIPAFGNLGAIIVAPDCPADRWDNPISEAYVMKLYKCLLDQYEIKNDKTLLAGYSFGGIGTWYIASKNQNEFAGALPISAKPLEEAIKVDWSIPIYVIHGREDEVFPVEDTVKAVELLKERKTSIEFKIVEGVTHYATYGFIEPLKEAIPWIMKVWGQSG